MGYLGDYLAAHGWSIYTILAAERDRAVCVPVGFCGHMAVGLALFGCIFILFGYAWQDRFGAEEKFNLWCIQSIQNGLAL